MAYHAKIEVLLDVDCEGEAADAMSSILSEQNMRKYVGEQSCLVDWRYVKHPAPISLPKDYEPDWSKWPTEA